MDIRQLTPHGMHPLLWKPKQISRYITPEIQVASFVEIFSNLSQLGVKQQKHRFYDVVEYVYLQQHGVLVNDPKVPNDGHWWTPRKHALAKGRSANRSARFPARKLKRSLCIIPGALACRCSMMPCCP